MLPLLIACNGEISDALPKNEQSSAELAHPCVSPLTVSSEQTVVATHGSLSVRAAGGTGAYRYVFARNVSGASLSPTTGVYVAGDRGGVADAIAVTDAGCDDIASIEVQVAAPLLALPMHARLRPRQALTFEVRGGSGSTTAAMVANPSGATLSGLTYMAGNGAGRDIVRFSDTALGTTRDAVLDIAEGNVFALDPPTIVLTPNAWSTLRASAGSGELEVTIEGEAATVADDVVSAVQVGNSRLAVVDRFTRESATVNVSVVAPRSMPLQRIGQYQLNASVVALGDIDGDGLGDFAVGYPETSTINGALSGAVYIYLGHPTTPKLHLVIPGQSRDARFGTRLAAGDVNGDGHVDLAVGAPLARIGANVNGAVYVFLGGGGSIASTPHTVIAGHATGDFLGVSVRLCDLNGDGALDLVTGSTGYEDMSGAAYDEGAVLAYVNDHGELPRAATTVSLGVERSSLGTAQGFAGMNMGSELAVGDFNGDGLCDVAGSGTNWSDDRAGHPAKGMVAVYLGLGPHDDSPGGLSATPRWLIPGLATYDLLGTSLAAGDLDGDGRAELLVGASREDGANGQDSGVLRAFALDGAEPLTLVPTTAAFWRFDGPSAFAYMSWGLDVGDMTGDGLGDIVVGTPLSDYTLGDGGSLAVFAGAPGSIPAPTATRRVDSSEASAWFGIAVAAVGDADGDGVGDGVAFAATSDGLGLDVGQPFFVGASATYGLAMPGDAGGANFGKSVQWFDADRDGDDDLVVGASAAGITWEGHVTNRTGALYVTLTDEGRPSTRSVVIGGVLPSLYPNDALGQALATGGDFDGDGAKDLVAIAAAGDGIPNGDAACSAAYSGDVGTAYVFTGRLIDSTPTFMVHGRASGLTLTAAAIDFDINGDHIDDLALASRYYGGVGGPQVGGVDIVLGRAPTAVAPQRICDVALRLEGIRPFDQMGGAVVGLGDIDGDGCGELAIGADFADVERADVGVVYVLYGWGGTGCAAAPRWVGFRVSGALTGQLGHSLAAGDLDGDGLRDLLIGEPAHFTGDDSRGAVWTLTGARIRSAAASAGAVVPGTQAPLIALGESGSMVAPRLDGTLSQGRFGSAIAVDSNRIIVGSEQALETGGATNLYGGAQVFDLVGARFTRSAVVSGEPMRPVNMLGEAVGLATLAGKSWVVVGGTFAGGAECGAVYVARVP